MKTYLRFKYVFVLTALLMAWMPSTHVMADDVAIDATNFPDENFRNYLLEQDYGQDGVLTQEEIAGITYMDVSEREISDLTGIKYFTALTFLNCSYNQLTSLDVSGCTALTWLSCWNNLLTSLDVSGCTALKGLYCFSNQLTSLDASGFTALTEFYCYNNQLSSLDVSGCTALSNLDCHDNQLTSLNVSGCTALTNLDCHNNQLTSLNVSGCTALTELSCGSNQLASFDVSEFTALTKFNCSYNQLTSLDVSKSTALIGLYCDFNQITTLDVSKCTALTGLSCSGNQLTSLDVSECTALTFLSCDRNQLALLNLSGCTALTGLYCSYNQLTSLKVSEFTALTKMECSGNQLTSLNVSNCTALTELWCNNNQLTSFEVSGCIALINLLCYNNELVSLDVSGCNALTYLGCWSNQLTSLNLSGHPALTVLECGSNQLTSLDVSGCTALTTLQCSSNKIKGEMMDALVSSLPIVETGEFYVLNTNDENECTPAQVAVTNAKGWKAYQMDSSIWDWVEMQGEDPALVLNYSYNDANHTATVIALEEGKYEGIIIIPETVQHNGQTYRVTSIGDHAFGDCFSMTAIIIPNSVTSIGQNVFFNCGNLTSVVIPNSVTEIGNGAFNCCGLTSIHIPNSVTTIGTRAFSFCQGLKSMTVEDGNTVFDSRNDCNAIIRTVDNTIISACSYTSIPHSVTTIGDQSYVGTSITTIDIPNGVTTIENRAFGDCYSLKTLTIPSSVNNIDRLAFNFCLALECITIDKDNTVYDSRDNCNAIIRTADDVLIVGCKNSIIPNSVKGIGSNAFMGHENLSTIVLPDGVSFIDEYAFAYCRNLTSITTPSSLKTIGEDAFYECNNLTSFLIPSTVSSIGQNAFSKCNSLIDIYCYAEDIPSTNHWAFQDTDLENVTLHVPASAINSYKTTFPWNQFGRIVAIGADEMAVPDEAIDLGLPSGTKWAPWNVGASKPEDYGGYYAWGETEEKDSYYWSTYIHCDGSPSSCHDIGMDIAGTEYDVAHVKWGGFWTMPTFEQLKELWDNCSLEWTTLNGINGCKFTGPNGNSIFLPASGMRGHADLEALGLHGCYWSSSVDEDCTYNGHCLGTYSGGAYDYEEGFRDYGRSVRPVISIAPIATDIAIDATNFPDENFRNYLLSQDYGQDGVLTKVEIAGITYMNVSEMGISDLTGIKYFTALTVLWCQSNQLTSLDVSNNTTLTVLICYDNRLTSLDLSKNTALTEIWCHYNQLASLDLSNNTKLQEVYCGYNQLTSMVVSNNAALTTIQCHKNNIDEAAMDVLISSMPSVEQGSFYAITHMGDEGNVCTSAQVTVANQKGWTVYKYDDWDWIEMEGGVGGAIPDEAIDLGLPSGTKWADRNVGASKPEDYGGFYAWGETEEKDYYDWTTYIHCDGTSGTCHDIGRDIAGTDYDVAHVKWGGSWTMPTLDQMKELLDNCSSEWTTVNGINGCKFTSKINGNSIFLPAAGDCWEDWLSRRVDSWGRYWSSTCDEGGPDDANSLIFEPDYTANWYYSGRLHGFSVRPVISKVGNINAEPYAVLSDDNTTLTFFYDNAKAERGGLSVGPFDSWDSPRWDGHAADITTVVFDDSYAECTTLTSTAFWFYQCKNLSSIVGIVNLKTENVTGMNCMFYKCSGLTSLDVSNFNTENVTNMSYMFYGCSGLTSLDVNNFNTENVTDMSSMFRSCFALTSLDLSSFNTENVSYMSAMFNDCIGLTSLDVSSFNTANVTNMNFMFSGCRSLTNLDLRNFNTANVTNMGAMFQECSSLTSLDLSNFNTEKVTDMNFMFNGCFGLTNLDLSNFDTENVTNLRNMFAGCSSLTSLDVSGFNTENVTNMSEMFYGCSALKTIYGGDWDTSSVTSSSSMFSGCKNLVGGKGTVYDVDHTDYTYAHIDGGEAAPGYFTAKNADTDISQIDNVIYVEQTEALVGSETTLSVKMKNTAQIRGFQFDMYLPEGVTVAKNNKGRFIASLSASRLDDGDEHTLTVTQQSDGSYRFLCGSLYEETFLGNDGEIATVKLNIAEDMEDGDYLMYLRKIKLTENDISKKYETAEVKSTLTISSYTIGDINDDGEVDVSDYIGIANHIMGNTPAGFNVKAADVDGDGVIDVSDYIGVANIILTGSVYGSQQQSRISRHGYME